MHAFKTASFLRPSSRPSSPPARPDSAIGLDLLRPTSKGPLNLLTLTSRKRPPTPTASPPTPTLVQDGSYLEALSLKLSEAVSKALAQPVGPPATGESLINGRRALPSGRGSAFGALIVSELEASASNPHLHRAIIRSLHRPLSVLLGNLSAQLLPVISSPQFLAYPSPSTPSTAQLHAAAYATFAAELLEVFDAYGLAQAEGHGIGMATDNLRSVREGFESLISRIINPLIRGLKDEIIPHIDALEHSPPLTPSSSTKQGFKGVNLSLHPSTLALQNLMPLYARTLMRYVTPPTEPSQTMLATLLISLVWRSLVALSRRAPSSTVQPVAPPQRKRRMNSLPTPTATTPPITQPSTYFSIKPPGSPPSAQMSSAASDARGLRDLFGILPRPDDNIRFALAREAADEAFGGLTALCALLDAEAAGGELGQDLNLITADLPTVIALPVLLRVFGKGSEDGPLSVAGLLRLTEEEYRATCLSGFGRAQECGPLVAKRVANALRERRDAKWDALVHWLEDRVSE